MMALVSPATGLVLRPDSAHSISDGVSRWPVIDGIPFLRISRDALVSVVLARLDAGQHDEALVLLLADQDAWWTGPVAEPEALHRLVQDRATLTLREAMALLSWGPVADYFAHRWSDPSFIAGLSLVETHWPSPETSFELACGIGHHLRALAQHGVRTMGADIVFAKLWLARQFVSPDSTLICFDAGSRWPIERQRFDLVCCHDAFYFLEPKQEILDRLNASAMGGTLLVGHIHNRNWPNLSAGLAITVDQLVELFPDGTYYDDAELTDAAAAGRQPRSAEPADLDTVEAFAVMRGKPGSASIGLLTIPSDGAELRRNPLYRPDGAVTWPSPRYEAEYAPRATYPLRSPCPPRARLDDATRSWARRRELLDLPDRW